MIFAFDDRMTQLELLNLRLRHIMASYQGHSYAILPLGVIINGRGFDNAGLS